MCCGVFQHVLQACLPTASLFLLFTALVINRQREPPAQSLAPTTACFALPSYPGRFLRRLPIFSIHDRKVFQFILLGSLCRSLWAITGFLYRPLDHGLHVHRLRTVKQLLLGHDLPVMALKIHENTIPAAPRVVYILNTYSLHSMSRTSTLIMWKRATEVLVGEIVCYLPSAICPRKQRLV